MGFEASFTLIFCSMIYGLSDKNLAEKALNFGVYTPPLSFYCAQANLPDAFLLGYTGISPTEILTGVKNLRKMFETL